MKREPHGLGDKKRIYILSKIEIMRVIENCQKLKMMPVIKNEGSTS